MNFNRLRKNVLTFTMAGILTFSTLPANAALGDIVLKKGMQHEDVKELQQLLKSHGYFHEEETTTYFGDVTYNAIINLQKSLSLSQDGIFGPQTYQALLALNSPSIPVDEGVNAVDVVIYPEIENKVELLYERDLKLEVTGQDVNQLQEALKMLGYLIIENTTDYFGTQTEQAVRSFQEAYVLNVDGIASQDTIQMINDVISGRKAPVPVPTRSDTANRSQTIAIISTAKKYLGVPYRYGGSTTKGFDCSGFTQFVFKQHGISIPRSTVDQAKIGAKISRADLQPGDLIIFSNTYKKGPSHTGIYLGNGQFIHSSSNRSGGVIISDLDSTYYSGKFSYGQKVY